MNKRKILLVAAAVFVAATVYVVCSPIEQVRAHPFFTRYELLVIAHRGGRGLWPENTLYGFRRAVELGVDVLEMDVLATADGMLVVHHDDEVNRTTNGEGRVEDLSFEEIQSLDAGHSWTDDGGRTYPFRGLGIKVPALEEVLVAFPKTRLVVEIKAPSNETAISLCRTIRSAGREETVLVASFHQEAMNTFRAECPEVATSATPREALFFYQLNRLHLNFLQSPRAEALQVPETFGDIDVLTPLFLSGARRFNIQVHVWTVNTVEAMKRVAGLGVDGIMTDYPDRLLQVLGRESGSVDGEGNDVGQRVGAGGDHDQTIDTQSDSGARRKT